MPPKRNKYGSITVTGVGVSSAQAAADRARAHQSTRLAQQDSIEHAERLQADKPFDIAYDTEDILPVSALAVDYENAKTLDALGVPVYLIREMYNHDPDMLEALAMHYEPMPSNWIADEEYNTYGS